MECPCLAFRWSTLASAELGFTQTARRASSRLIDFGARGEGLVEVLVVRSSGLGLVAEVQGPRANAARAFAVRKRFGRRPAHWTGRAQTYTMAFSRPPPSHPYQGSDHESDEGRRSSFKFVPSPHFAHRGADGQGGCIFTNRGRLCAHRCQHHPCRTRHRTLAHCWARTVRATDPPNNAYRP